MSYTPNIEGFEGQKIEVDVSPWSGAKMLVNGEAPQAGAKRGEMVLQRTDGRQVTATWKPQGLGLDVPQLVVDGKTINVVEPLKWYQWAWIGWSFILIIRGGLLGGLAGGLALALNTKIFRMEMSSLLKYLITGAVSVVAVILYIVVIVLISLAING